MRRSVGHLVLAALLVSSAAVLAGDDAVDSVVDVSAFRDDMVVLTNGGGHYLIAVPVSKHFDWAFVGDGKSFHQMLTFGGGMQAGVSYSRSFWAPRQANEAHLSWRNNKWTVMCGDSELELEVVPDEQAKQMLGSASFHTPLWKRSAFRLARDDRGTYFYVDRARDEYGGRDWLVYKGQKGNLELQKMTNIVHDSEGDIFSMSKGKIRLLVDDDSATWIDGSKRTELVVLPLHNNLKLIYSELGVYLGELGTPCDNFL